MNDDRILSAAKKLIKYPNVIGFKIINHPKKGKCLQVLVERKVSEAALGKKFVIPKMFKGLPTDVLECDVPTMRRNKQRTRPYQPGQSISSLEKQGRGFLQHAGTLGFIAQRDTVVIESTILPHWLIKLFSPKFQKRFFVTKSRPVGVTNFHVAANAPVVQPGTLDNGNVKKNGIGEVVAHGDIKKGEYDVSIIQLNNEKFKTEILNLGKIKKVVPAKRNTPVQKSGRTSGISKGKITNTSMSILVNMSSEGNILFTDVIEIDKVGKREMLLPGDSGSAILDGQKNLVGLGFAAGNRFSYAIKADKIMQKFGLRL